MAFPSAIGKEKLTVSSTAVGFASITAGASSALIRVGSNGIRYWADGSTPDSSTGLDAAAGDVITINGNLAAFKAIRSGGADAILQIQYLNGLVEGPALVPTGGAGGGGGAVTNAGTFAVQDSQTISDDSAFGVASSKLFAAGFLADESATDSVDEGDTGAARITLDRKLINAIYAHAAGGYTPGKLISAATTNATSVKGSAGTLGYVCASNVNAAARYLKIYNKATAPTVGTDTPVAVFLIPGNTAGAGTNIPLPAQGMALGTGIGFAITTGVADADTGAVAANELVVNYGYI